MRLDAYLAANGLSKSRTSAKAEIEAGLVEVDGVAVFKPSFEVTNEKVTVTGSLVPYVSRGGLKLRAALDHFSVDVRGLDCIDVGASTGGFTDCLLQRGAASVLCVDCGHGQLDPKIAADPRVRSLEGFNARGLSPETVGGTFDLCVMDVSFISQTLIHRPAAGVLKHGSRMITLIKPQFECGRSALNSKGVVKSEEARKSAVKYVCFSAEGAGFRHIGTVLSPVEGGDGNIEYLALFEYDGGRSD